MASVLWHSMGETRKSHAPTCTWHMLRLRNAICACVFRPVFHEGMIPKGRGCGEVWLDEYGTTKLRQVSPCSRTGLCKTFPLCFYDMLWQFARHVVAFTRPKVSKATIQKHPENNGNHSRSMLVLPLFGDFLQQTFPVEQWVLKFPCPAKQTLTNTNPPVDGAACPYP